MEIPSHNVSSDWAELTEVPEAATAWAHSGLVATSGGELIGFHAGQLVAFGNGGHLVRVVSQGLTEGHGITLVREGDTEYLWVADPGFVFACTSDDGDAGLAAMFGKGLRQETREPRVVKLTVSGEILAELPMPPTDPNAAPGLMGAYCPTSIAIDEERFGGSGDIWVADGYGNSLVHRFDRDLHHVSTLSGDEGAGRFSCPRAVFIDRRSTKSPELYIADRSNKRVQVYGLDGRFHRTFGEGFLNSPSGFAQWGDVLVVAELYARLAALDADDHFVGYIGGDPDIRADQGWPDRPGWPNALGNDGRAQAPHDLKPDRFNSPHSLAVDADGNLFVSEWLIGGHVTKLEVRR
jgi:hypothetical protein